MVAVAALAVTVGCTATGTAGATVRIYTSVTQETVDAVVAGYTAAHPGVDVEVFRAPTGELTARIAAELRDGELGADVLWLTDPLSMQQYEADGLLLEWDPDGVDQIPEEFRTPASFGTRLLNLVIVAGPTPALPLSDWEDLARVDGTVALPDPGFAGSAYAALGFFGLDPAFGMPFYRSLRDNGAIEVRSPGDVVTGVAEGVYAAGISLDMTTRSAMADGSPVELIWPDSGAITFHSPISLVAAAQAENAPGFVEYVLTVEAQQSIADTGWEPVNDEIGWPHAGPQRSIDWAEAAALREELLDAYWAIFDS